MQVLKKIWGAWKAFAHVLGKVQTLILLTLFYVFILGPVALIFLLLGKSALPYKSQNSGTYWLAKSRNTRGEAQYFQQY